MCIVLPLFLFIPYSKNPTNEVTDPSLFTRERLEQNVPWSNILVPADTVASWVFPVTLLISIKSVTTVKDNDSHWARNERKVREMEPWLLLSKRTPHRHALLTWFYSLDTVLTIRKKLSELVFILIATVRMMTIDCCGEHCCSHPGPLIG